MIATSCACAAKLLARVAPWLALLGLGPVASAQQQDSTGAPSAALATIATRVRVETGDNVAIGGFIITGNAPKKVVLVIHRRFAWTGMARTGHAMADELERYLEGEPLHWEITPERALLTTRLSETSRSVRGV